MRLLRAAPPAPEQLLMTTEKRWSWAPAQREVLPRREWPSTASGLLELKRNRYGEGLLAAAEFRRPAWEAVRKVWTQPAIRDAFTDTLREHIDELLEDVKGRLGAGPSGGWHEAWDVLKPLIPPDRRVDELTKIMAGMNKTATALPAEERAGLLSEWSQEAPASAAETPIRILAPAFMISELRRAFEIGFMLFIPFLIIDLVVSSLLMSMGMMMVPPITISLPFKLIFFVLVDGWRLVAGSLIESFNAGAPPGG